MRVYVAKLKMELDRVQLEFDDGSRPGVSSTASSNVHRNSSFSYNTDPSANSVATTVTHVNGLHSITERSDLEGEEVNENNSEEARSDHKGNNDEQKQSNGKDAQGEP